MPKKILKIVSGFDDGGVFSSECSYIQELNAKGFDVDLIIIGSGDRTSHYKSLTLKSLVLPSIKTNLGGSIINKLIGSLKLIQYGKKYAFSTSKEFNYKYDAIIYRRPIFLFFAGKLGSILKANVFWHMPNIVNSGFSKKFYEYFLPKYNIEPIANSEFTKNTISSLCKHVVYPGFSSERVISTNRNFRQELNIPFDKPVYGMAGRVCPDKAQDILIEAFIRSEAYANGAHLILAGKIIDKSFEDVLHQVSGDALGKQIHLLGRIDDLPKFYSTIDVAINSRRNVEPFGISIVEALAAGKPVLAYYLGGPSEIIQENKNGWLVKGNDIDSWIEGINNVEKQRNLWDQFKLQALAGSQRFNVSQNVEKLIEIISINKSV